MSSTELSSATQRFQFVSAQAEAGVQDLQVVGAQLSAAQALASSAQQDAAEAKAQRDALQVQVGTLEAQTAEQAARILALEEELRRRPPAPEPPIEVGPSLKMTLLGQEFGVAGRGERELNEERWATGTGDAIRLGFDVHDKGRILAWFGHYWLDLPTAAAPIRGRLLIEHDGRPVYDGDLALHPHCNPAFLVRPGSDGEVLPRAVELQDLIARGMAPNYDPAAALSEVELAAMEACTSFGQGYGSWQRWNPPGGFALGEDFSRIRGGFTGGAAWGDSNEAAPHTRAFVGALTTRDPRARKVVDELALTAGNYRVCYFSRATGRPALPEELPELPVLTADGLPTGWTAAGVKLPPPDIAHLFPLAAPMALLAESRWAREVQECWALLPTMTKKGSERALGNLYSLQIRGAAWGLLALWYAYLSCPEGPRREALAARIRYNLEWMASTYARPGGDGYRVDGCAATIKRPPANAYCQYITDPSAVVTSTWQHWYMVTVLDELRVHGFPQAEEMERHVLRLAEAMWTYSPSHYDSPWPYVVVGPKDQDPAPYVKATFAGRATAPTRLMSPNTPELVGPYLAALAAGVNLGMQWAGEALAWLRPRAAVEKGGIPITWAILPRA